MTISNLLLRPIVLWGIPALGLVFSGFLYWDSLWEHSERIRNLALVAAAVFGLPIAAWRSYTAYRQAETAQSSLLDERYQSAAEMLGGKMAVRLAGIHALARMAKRHLTHHALIMSALSAVVRTSAKRKLLEDSKPAPEDVTVIMEVLAGKSPEQLLAESEEEYQLDLRDTDLRMFPLHKVKFPRAILDYAVLSDSKYRAVFWKAEFQDASLIGVSLVGALFSGANFAFADLTYANLTDAELNEVDFHGATLTNANFSDAKFERGIDLENAVLDGTNLINVTGLTQQQLNTAQIDPSRPPILTGAADPDTGQPLAVPA